MNGLEILTRKISKSLIINAICKCSSDALKIWYLLNISSVLFFKADVFLLTLICHMYNFRFMSERTQYI